MRHPIIYALLSLLLLVGCAHQHQRGEYEVLGTVEGLEDGDTIYVTNDLQGNWFGTAYCRHHLLMYEL